MFFVILDYFKNDGKIEVYKIVNSFFCLVLDDVKFFYYVEGIGYDIYFWDVYR